MGVSESHASWGRAATSKGSADILMFAAGSSGNQVRSPWHSLERRKRVVMVKRGDKFPVTGN